MVPRCTAAAAAAGADRVPRCAPAEEECIPAASFAAAAQPIRRTHLHLPVRSVGLPSFCMAVLLVVLSLLPLRRRLKGRSPSLAARHGTPPPSRPRRRRGGR